MMTKSGDSKLQNDLMKKLIILTLLFSAIAGNCFAQQGKLEKDTLHVVNNPSNNPGLRYQAKPYNGPPLFSTPLGTGHRQQGKLYKDTAELSNTPLYIVTFKSSTKIYSANYISVFVGQRKILNMEIYKQDSLIKYGPKAKNGIIKFTLDKGNELVSLEKLIDKYHLSKQYKKLPVYIDSAMAFRRPIYFDPEIVKTVSIATDNDTGSKFINVLTTSPTQIKYNPNELYIRGLTSN